MSEKKNTRAELGSEPPYNELLRCLENDWYISASWDGLRKFWLIGLTEEGVKLRDTEHGTLTAEQVREAIFSGSSYASYDGAKYYADGISMQAIADELNSRAERTCKPLGTIRYDYEGGYAGFEYETELSCGHKWRDSYGDYPNYCPNCGAHVTKSDQYL